MQNQINTSPLTQFAQALKSAELSQQKEVKLTIHQARLLNVALVEVLDKVNRDLESVYNALKGSASTETISVSMDGGTFGDTK